ncbi:MFS transporter [Rhodovibrio salinarum]|uniref:MFS transporter n=1 Tax=Rhodovibrio salinarum TaxID=1087 RepID=A0A934QEL3_9PROT|nr:MFS transporter [Rhodovibrio salinarum]MBK1695821.1 MFS transporter [Rhodovibrio salinarum]
MLKTLAPVVALLVSVALLLMGNGLQGTLLPLRAQLEAFGALQIGWLGSAYFAGFALGSWAGPRFVRRVGHIRAFTALAAIASATVLGHALAIQPDVWLPLRAVTGFCLAGLYVVMESWLNAQATNATRGAILSVYTTINLTVITLGQLLVAVLEPQTFVPFAVAAMLIALAGVPLALTTSKPPAGPTATGIRPLWLYRISPVGLVGCFAVGLANGPFWTLAPAFAVANGLDSGGVGLFMALVVLGGAVGQWPAGRLSDKLDRRYVILGTCILAAGAGIALVAAALHRPALLPYAGLAFGAFAIPLYALCVAHTNDFVPSGQFVQASAGLLLASALGSAFGPALASFVMAQAGSVSLFAFSAGVHLLLAAFVFVRLRTRAAPEAKAPFVAVPRTSTGLSTLDPRAGKR